MSKTFIIAEAACTWLHGGLEAAYRSIKAAKECGADAWKTQWTSDPLEMGKRRGMDGEKYSRLAWDPSWHELLAARCKEYGIEYLCTVFIPKDIPLIAPYVSRFKVSAFEGKDQDFILAHMGIGKPLIVSVNDWATPPSLRPMDKLLHCVSNYPTALEDLSLRYGLQEDHCADGLSDHTTSTLTGAVAVGAGARILEKHVRLSDTPSDDPDYGHSLVLDLELDYAIPFVGPDGFTHIHSKSSSPFKTYVDNVREAERML